MLEEAGTVTGDDVTVDGVVTVGDMVGDGVADGWITAVSTIPISSSITFSVWSGKEGILASTDWQAIKTVIMLTNRTVKTKRRKVFMLAFLL